ncbi:MAG: hypothetical protein CMJ62_13140 [Planctomycetaceae bacterium]|nr:hypothetical protein [Planctomycetaceae bacterium]
MVQHTFAVHLPDDNEYDSGPGDPVRVHDEELWVWGHRSTHLSPLAVITRVAVITRGVIQIVVHQRKERENLQVVGLLTANR